MVEDNDRKESRCVDGTVAQSKARVFVVDDNRADCESIGELIESIGLSVSLYFSGEEFLQRYTSEQPGCAIFDVRLPRITGLELQEELQKRDAALPVILLTGYGDIPMAVRAMQRGASGFLEKPYRSHELVELVQKAIRRSRHRRDALRRIDELNRRFLRLSGREFDVLNSVVSGKPNKTIAAELGISQRTVEAHRAHCMKKLEVDSVAEVVRLRLEHLSLGRLRSSVDGLS